MRPSSDLDSVATQVVRNLFDLQPPLSEQELKAYRHHLIREGLWGLALQRSSDHSGGLTEPLKSDYLACVVWEMRCLTVLNEISMRTRALGIPVITFKGCSLAFSGLYRPAQRAFGDIDLAIPLVHRDQFLTILIELGYTVTLSQGEALRDGVFLDLHHHPLHQLANAVEEDPQAWFREAQPLDHRCGNILRLHPRHEFILSLFHGAKHAYSRMNWLVDLALLIRAQDPALLAREVGRYRAGRHLWLAGACMKGWFDLDLPAQLQKVCQPPRAWDPFSPFLLRRILARTAPDYLGMLTPLWATGGLKRRLRYLHSSLFPDNIKLRTRLRQLFKMVVGLGSGQAHY